MLERYKNAIAKYDDPADIAAEMIFDKDFRSRLDNYRKYQYDVEFYDADTFRLAISSVNSDIKSIKEPEEALTAATIEASSRLACAGARYISTDFSQEPLLKMLGLVKSGEEPVRMCFSNKGETIYLVSSKVVSEEGEISGDRPVLAIEKAVANGYVVTAHAVSPANGLFLSLVESAYPNGFGFDITTDSEMDEKDFLFGRCGYIAILAVDESKENEFVDFMFNNNVGITLLGHVTKGEIRIDDESYGFINEIFA